MQMDEDASTQSDYDIALQIACGEEDGIRALIREHGPRVRGYLEKRFPRVWEDAWQRALIRVVDKINSFDPDKGSLGVWFMKLAHRCACSEMRAENRHSCEAAQEDIDHDKRRPPNQPSAPKQRREAERRAEQIREAIAALPPKGRRVIEADLAFWRGDTAPDEVASAGDLAAEWGDTTENAIHQARHRARKKLREELIRRGAYREDTRP
ncbi:MAG: sigma-70 family RNA polymerase sigma factor [Phycisphaeraceae bacterium]|nr:sigma-70 family RNA polymerase sigma factor [Phycisphaeraceae bacterium]